MIELLSRISLFRWRLEWLFLAMAAVGLVLGEEAREARERDPYELVQHGRAATAVVRNAREDLRSLGMRRGEPQQETRTFLDLEWWD